MTCSCKKAICAICNPAFGFTNQDRDPHLEQLRDDVAIAALQGLLSSKPFNKHDIARSAYEYADAMILARDAK